MASEATKADLQYFGVVRALSRWGPDSRPLKLSGCSATRNRLGTVHLPEAGISPKGRSFLSSGDIWRLFSFLITDIRCWLLRALSNDVTTFDLRLGPS